LRGSVDIRSLQLRLWLEIILSVASFSMVFKKLLVSSLGALFTFGLYQLVKLIITQRKSPLRDLPGPETSHWFYGNLREIWKADNSVLHEKWVSQYGPTLTYKGFFNRNGLLTMDTRAINYVLMNSDDFQKPDITRSNLASLLGEGLLVVEGDKHRQERKIMNPAFGYAQIRELTEIFVDKSIQLRDIWSSNIAKNAKVVGSVPIDVLSWLSRTALDIIGLAGFNYKFDTLNTEEKPNELSEAFQTVFQTNTELTFVLVLRNMFPFLRIFPSNRDEKEAQARKVMKRIGTELLRESQAAVTAANTSDKGGSVEKKSIQSRDLLSLLVRANTATDLPDNQRLDDADVLAQVPTFLVAGHETTSTATTWALYALTQDQTVQAKLRNELLSVSTSNPTMDELNALPYLDYVIRETLRLHAPVPSTIRVAMKDDVLPLNSPYVDKNGAAHNGIRVAKGDRIFIPILALNRSRELWGEDSMEFKPERWESLPDPVSSIPGVWGNMLTFLGGPHACIGYRFALLEMKVLLFTLVRAFEFELAVPAKDIIKKTGIVQRPVVVGDPEGGNKMPLLVKPYTSI